MFASHVSRPRLAGLVTLAAALLLGFLLRIYLLPGQILLDDEWHSLIFIKQRTLGQVLTEINPLQNSSPLLNLYDYVCYHTIGVSEWSLRLPVLLAGTLLVVLVPLVLQRCYSGRALVLHALLLSVSPFLIFYSRFSRSYIIMTLLALVALAAAHRWLSSGRHRAGLLFVLAGVAAVYAHVSCLALVLAPYAAYGVARLLARWPRYRAAAPALRPGSVLVYAAGQLALIALVLLSFLKERRKLPLNVMPFRAADIDTVLGLVVGSSSALIMLVILTSAVVGGLVMFRRHLCMALILSLGMVANVVFILGLNPVGIESSAVFVRYIIAVIPILLGLSAVGIDRVLAAPLPLVRPGPLRGTAGAALPILLPVVLLAGGPLPVIYRRPNNFTGHLAYQGSYAYGDWQRSRSNHYFPSFEVAVDQVPELYRQLGRRESDRPIIEYPFDFADHSNLYYFYQRQHRRRVIAGYCSDAQRIRLATDAAMMARMKRENVTMAYTRPEFFISDARIKERTHFRNMVDLTDDDAVTATGADYLVLHKAIQSVYLSGKERGNFPLGDWSVAEFAERYRQRLGGPVFEDEQIVVFALRTS